MSTDPMKVTANQFERLGSTLQNQYLLQVQLNSSITQQTTIFQNMIRAMQIVVEKLHSIGVVFSNLGKVLMEVITYFNRSLPSANQNLTNAFNSAVKMGNEFAPLNKDLKAFKDMLKEKEDEEEKEEGPKKVPGFKEGIQGMLSKFEAFNPKTMFANIKESLKLGFHGGEGISDIGIIGTGQRLGKLLQVPFQFAAAPMKSMGEMLKPMGQEFAAMGPHMLALMLVTRPLMELLRGLLEPFEPIIEAFGMLGELLGMIIQPITNEIALALVNLISNMAPLIPSLAEFAHGLFNLVMPIFATINTMAATGATFGQAMAMVIGDALKMILEGLFNAIPIIIELLIQIFSGLLSFLPTFLESIGPILKTFFTDIIHQLWNDLKTATSSFFDLRGGKFWFWNWFD